jgi:hypothetical protein
MENITGSSQKTESSELHVTQKPHDLQTQADDDEQFLSRNKHDIEKILQLIADRTDYIEAERQLAEIQERVDAKKQGTVFHQHTNGNKKIALNHHTSNLLKLSKALELSLTTIKYGSDLHKELDTHLEKRVEVLHRVKRRKMA